MTFHEVSPLVSCEQRKLLTTAKKMKVKNVLGVKLVGERQGGSLGCTRLICFFFHIIN